VPVSYPVTADWSASPSVHIGSDNDRRPWHTANFDPTTGQLTAFRPATVTIAVTVNGVSQRQTIDLTAQTLGEDGRRTG
jgi:hypothetical protein